VPAASKIAACLAATISISGCTGSVNGASSSSTSGHGSLTDREFAVAVAIARAAVAKYAATITSATATVGKGIETQTNVGPACTSGTLLYIKLIGTFPTIVAGPVPTAGASGTSNDNSVSAILITADPASGKACLLGVRTGATKPDRGSTQLFTASAAATSPVPSTLKTSARP